MWTRRDNQKWIRDKFAWLIGDFPYLVMTIVLGFAMYFAGRVEADVPLLEVIRQLLIGLLIGSEFWDLGFGYVVDQDPFFPFNDWAFGWGFQGVRWYRIRFDIIRCLAAAGLICVGTLG